MTIDEAITYEKELSEKDYLQGMLCHANPNDEKLDEYIEYGRYHEQLAEWLKEYKRLKELFANNLKKDCNTCEQAIYEKAYKDGQDKGFSDGHFFGYNKAIDNFVKVFTSKTNMENKLVEEISKQLKVGAIND